MLFNRIITDDILQKLANFKQIIIVFGPRQVGKTTLIKQLLKTTGKKIQEINADENRYIDLLSSRNSNKLALVIGNSDILFIDEAQRIPDIGINLKILHDQFPKTRIIITGSSSLDLAGKTKESLAGRTWTYNLFPIAICEIIQHISALEVYNKIDEYLLYGLYPNVIKLAQTNDKIKYLSELCESALFKDIFEFSGIKNSAKIRDLLKLLAYQIGSEVSIHELANILQIGKNTVDHYIDLLEKSYIVFRLSAYATNQRNEISKKQKIYFYDVGIRNAVINNFSSLELRNDYGALWENFLLAERIKYNAYYRQNIKTYFWRNYSGVEIDYIEENSGEINAFEFSLNSKRKRKPESFFANYSNANWNTIDKDNFIDFVSK